MLSCHFSTYQKTNFNLGGALTKSGVAALAWNDNSLYWRKLRKRKGKEKRCPRAKTCVDTFFLYDFFDLCFLLYKSLISWGLSPPQNHSVQLTAPKTMPMTVPRMRSKRRNVCLVFLVIILSLCAKRSQQGGCHGYNNLYNDFPNTNFSHNI